MSALCTVGNVDPTSTFVESPFGAQDYLYYVQVFYLFLPIQKLKTTETTLIFLLLEICSALLKFDNVIDGISRVN